MKRREFSNHFSAVSTLHLALAAGIFSLFIARASGAVAVQSPNTLSLAQAFPGEKLEQILLPRDQWHPVPTLKNRETWQALPKAVSNHLLELGEKSLKEHMPPLPATLYLGYARTGNRSDFEQVFFARRVLLQNLVLAECVEGKGRFLDAAADALWSICEESTWCLPAHVGVQQARVGLPDITEPIVDLFAGESAVTVAWGASHFPHHRTKRTTSTERADGIRPREAGSDGGPHPHDRRPARPSLGHAPESPYLACPICQP